MTSHVTLGNILGSFTDDEGQSAIFFQLLFRPRATSPATGRIGGGDFGGGCSSFDSRECRAGGRTARNYLATAQGIPNSRSDRTGQRLLFSDRTVRSVADSS